MEAVGENMSVLSRDVLNVVGELHTESGARRDLEKEFISSTLGPDAGYWTEADFPAEDWQPTSMSRVPRQRGADATQPAADLMEFRGAHGTAILIGDFTRLCDEATRVGADGASGTPAIAAFLQENLRAFVNRKKRVQSTWTATATDELPESGRDQFVKVNEAVEAVYAAIDGALQQLVTQMKSAMASGSVQEQRAALQALGASRDAVAGLAQPLAAAVGSSDTTEASELSADMRLERSKYMALAAQMSNLKGVWKVGDGHVSDLIEGRVNVETSRANIVSRETFNKEFDDWKRWKENRAKKAQRQARSGSRQEQPQ
jgi:hypothetical protein